MSNRHSQRKLDILLEELQIVEALLRLTLDQEECQTEDPQENDQRRLDFREPSAVFTGLERPDSPH